MSDSICKYLKIKTPKQIDKKFKNKNISIIKLINTSIKNNYSNSNLFYKNIIVKRGYKKFFERILNIKIIKENIPIDTKLLSIGYLPDDKLETMLFRMMMKMKLIYGLNINNRDDIECIKEMLIRIEESFGIKQLQNNSFINFDEYLNSDDQLREIIKSTLGFTFIKHVTHSGDEFIPQ